MGGGKEIKLQELKPKDAQAISNYYIAVAYMETKQLFAQLRRFNAVSHSPGLGIKRLHKNF